MVMFCPERLSAVVTVSALVPVFPLNVVPTTVKSVVAQEKPVRYAPAPAPLAVLSSNQESTILSSEALEVAQDVYSPPPVSFAWQPRMVT